MPVWRRTLLAIFAASAARAQTRAGDAREGGASHGNSRDRTIGMISARAAQWLAAWDGQGIHRTATEGDEAGAVWLAREAERIGGSVAFEAFALDRMEPQRGFVEIDGQIIPGVPMFDAPDTPPGGAQGLAGRPSGDAMIVLTELSPLVVYTPGFGQMRRASPARAIVAATHGGAPGLALLNAEAFRAPYGPPIVQVPSEAAEPLAAAFARGAAFRVVAESQRVPAHARNLVVTVKGSNPALARLVVMTPRSSWWQSSSERGGGLVCWLEALRALIAEPPARDVVFTANSGHELGHIGLDDFIARRPGWETAATWVHFGANIGAAGGRLSVVSPDDDLRAGVSDTLARHGVTGPVLAPKDTVPNGETRDIHRAGGRYVTLVGSNALFHLPQDRYPMSVDTDRVARIAAASAQMVAELGR